MKRIGYLFFSLLAFPIIIMSQYAKTKFDVMGDKEIDSGTISIYYNFHQIDSTRLNNDGTYKRFDIQRLEVGNNISKYYSYVLYDNDVKAKEWVKKNKSAGSIPIWHTTLAGQTLWSEYIRMVIIKDFSTNLLDEYIQMQVGMNPDYHYTENIPSQQWEVSEDTMIVAGYLCQKAICHFRGRDFVAWFTPEIPINNGPWKFGGLPGLIMKIYDKDEIFVYECVKVEQSDFKIYMPDFSKYSKVTENNKGKLKQLIKLSHEDWVKASGARSLSNPSKSFKSEYTYRPLELE